jgi:ESCRT-II complex subunit VPS36
MVKSDREYHEGLAIELGGLLTGHADEGGRKGKAREGLMVGPGGRGVIGLDEVWGLWMRARGVGESAECTEPAEFALLGCSSVKTTANSSADVVLALLSPSTLIAILPFLSAHTTPPIRALTLPSSLMVLYSPIYSPQAILFRLLAILTPSIPAESSDPGEAPSDNSNAHVEPSLSLIEIAAHEGLAVGLAKELIEEVERISGGPSPVTRHGVIEGIVRDEQAEEGSGGVRWYRDLISAWPISAM